MNQENKKQVIVAGILGVVLVVVLAVQWMRMSGPASVPATSSASNSASSSAAASSASSSGGASIPAGEIDDVTSLTALKEELDQLVLEISDVNFKYADQKIPRNPFAPSDIFSNIRIGGPLLPQSEELTASIPETLNGIIYNPERPYAIIDDELVTVGHRFGEHVVLQRIERKRVIINVGDSEFVLELMKEQ